jgi:hypothetical protein
MKKKDVTYGIYIYEYALQCAIFVNKSKISTRLQLTHIFRFFFLLYIEVDRLFLAHIHRLTNVRNCKFTDLT